MLNFEVNKNAFKLLLEMEISRKNI